MKKEITTWIYSLVLIAVFLMFTDSCKKKDDNNTSPPTPVTLKDVDGNLYHTITIGTQIWMVENLKTTRYNDGTSIQLVIDNQEWYNRLTPGYCWYNNDPETYKNTYGALYNWFTVKTGKLAPTGSHVPTNADWTILLDFRETGLLLEEK